jgi:hypothetical protein
MEESYHEPLNHKSENPWPELENLSDCLIDETRGSIHPSEIEDWKEEEEQQDPEPSTSKPLKYKQRTLDELGTQTSPSRNCKPKRVKSWMT